MKNQILKNLIKEEIKKILREEEEEATVPSTNTKQPAEVKKIVDFLTGIGKGSLAQINTPQELSDILNVIWDGMNTSMQKNATAIAIKKIADQRLGVK